MRAHVEYYRRYVGEIPPGLQIDHLCRVIRCVNPDHLEAVTLRENVRRGARAKLSVEKAAEIRQLYAQGVRRIDLSKMYEVHPTSIDNVVQRFTWRD